MTITLSLSWWMVPTIITLLTFAWAIFWPHKNDECGLVSMMATGLAAIVSLVSWMVAGFLK